MQPLDALYPTVRLSPWRQVRRNIHSRVWTAGPTWSVLQPGGPPLLVPLISLWQGDMGVIPGDWSGLLSRVATPGTTRSSLLSWSPYPQSYVLPCHQNFAHYFCVFSVYIWHRTFIRNHCQLEEFIKFTITDLISLKTIMCVFFMIRPNSIYNFLMQIPAILKLLREISWLKGF